MTVLNPATLDAIRARQAQIRPLQTFLTILAAVFFAVGWVVGHAFSFAWSVVSWSAAAVMVGYRDARPVKHGGG